MKPNIIERALEMATESKSVVEVKQKLKAEGYDQIDQHLSGKFTRGQIVRQLLPNDKKRRVR